MESYCVCYSQCLQSCFIISQQSTINIQSLQTVQARRINIDSIFQFQLTFDHDYIFDLCIESISTIFNITFPLDDINLQQPQSINEFKNHHFLAKLGAIIHAQSKEYENDLTELNRLHAKLKSQLQSYSNDINNLTQQLQVSNSLHLHLLCFILNCEKLLCSTFD